MKRAESQLNAFQNLIERGIHVELISEDLYTVIAEADAVETAKALQSQGFDECGVFRNGSTSEVVRCKQLTHGTVGDHARSLTSDRRVAPPDSLWSCMDRIASSGPLYLAGENGLEGIVTVADLNKQPARLLMFGIVSMLEMVLLALVRRYYDGEAWQGKITQGRVREAENLYGDRVQSGEEIDLADCLQLCDKADVCIATDGIIDQWSMSKNKARELLKSLQKIRNNLAHAQSPAGTKTWTEIVDVLRHGHDILARSAALLQSDEDVVTEAAS